MEEFLLNSGFSWIWSKIIPYLVFVVLGIVLYLVAKGLTKRKLFKRLLLLVIPVPFLLYFAVHPIYEGDFVNNADEVELKSNEFSEGLNVLAIAGCPFCYDSIDDLLKIKRRTKSSVIHFIVYTDDSLNTEWYREKAGDEIKVIALPKSDSTISYAKGTFPAFLVKKGDKAYVWTNDNFGVGARDQVERLLSSDR